MPGARHGQGKGRYSREGKLKKHHRKVSKDDSDRDGIRYLIAAEMAMAILIAAEMAEMAMASTNGVHRLAST